MNWSVKLGVYRRTIRYGSTLKKDSVLRHTTRVDLRALRSVKGALPKTTFHHYEMSKVSRTTEVVRTVAARDWGVGNEWQLVGLGVPFRVVKRFRSQLLMADTLYECICCVGILTHWEKPDT